MIRRELLRVAALAVAATAAVSCNTVDDSRLPAMPVNINLSTPALWNTYGVHGYGDSRRFIAALREPRDFAFTAQTATGYGGILLVCGFNPFTLDAGVPMAYDLACPVECRPEVRVQMQRDDEAVPFAVCPECGSRYDVVERGGSPTEGEALSRKLGLTRYECRMTTYGGYLITAY